MGFMPTWAHLNFSKQDEKETEAYGFSMLMYFFFSIFSLFLSLHMAGNSFPS